MMAFFLGLLCVHRTASAIILYDVGVGFRQNGFNIFRGQRTDPQEILVGEFSYGGALCPAPGTPNFLCGRLHSQGGLNGSRLFLKSEARLKRTDAQGPNHEYAAYADTVIWVPSLGTNSAATGTGAYFFFGLQGMTAKSTNNPAVTVQAFAVATLETGTTASVQCVDEACSAPIPVLVRSFNPTSGFRLRLRSDVAIVAPTAPTGYDAEAIADFDDTLELLAIQIVDDQDRPVPGASVFIPDDKGQPMVEIPSTPLDTTTTTTLNGTSTTTTTLAGGGTTTTTLAGGSTTTTTVAGSTTTTSVPVVPTTTTTVPCVTPTCILDGGLQDLACAGIAIPAKITTKLQQAKGAIEQVATTSGKAASKLSKRAKRALAQAKAGIRRATRSKKPKLSAGCAAALVETADALAAGVPVAR